MIADWTVEVGPESPIIVLPWEGWVNLRGSRAAKDSLSCENKAAALSEVRQYPELLPLLETANTLDTFTSKIDVFPMHRDEVDPEIAEAGLEATACGLGSYLDLLPARCDVFAAFEDFERTAREAVSALKLADLPGSSIEIVVRPARLYDKQTFGWTLYAMGFGPDEAAARTTWAEAATLLVRGMRQHVSNAVPKHGEMPAQPGKEYAANAGE